MTDLQILREINRRKIGLTFALDTWVASVESVKSARQFTPPVMEIVSATGRTAEEAVAALIGKLDAQGGLFEEEAA